MSELLKSVFLGLVQGLTEFLPISSSGHLAILHKLLGFETESNLFFDTLLHLATLMAVLIFYRSQIRDLITGALYGTKSLFQGKGLKKSFYETKDTRLLTFIFIGSIPTALIGIFFKDMVEDMAKNLVYVGSALLCTSVLLFLYEIKRKAFRNINSMKVTDSLGIGIIQGIAVIPGISRSGSTIATAKILGIEKETAANYSFLLSIPAVAGAFILQIKDLNLAELNIDMTIAGAGFLASFLSGYFSLKLLIWLIKKANLKIFMVYCLLVGSISIIFS